MQVESDLAVNDGEIHAGHGIWPDDLRRGIWPRSFAIWVLAVWIALLVIRPWEVLMPALADWRVERMYAIFAMIAVFVAGTPRIPVSHQSPGLFFWFIALTLSTACAIDRSLAWESYYVYLTVFIFYLAILSVIRTPYQLVFIVTCFVAVMAVYLGKSQWEYFFHGGHGFSMGVRRLQGMDTTYSHPNAVACSAALSLPFAFFLWKIRGRYTAEWPGLYRRCFPYAVIGYLVLAATSIFLTNSRSGIFAFALFVILAALGERGAGKLFYRILLGGILLAGIWIVLPADTKGRLANTWDPTSGPEAESAYVSGEGRVEGLKMGWKMYQQFPLAGVGLGNFLPYRKARLDGIPLVAHNTIGGVLGEMGTIGALAFTIFLAGAFLDCRKTRRLAEAYPNSTAEVLSRLAAACRNSLILLLFTGMFGDNQGRAQLYWVAAFCLLTRSFIERIDDDRDGMDYE
ncbi:MAG: O-antigen ligase family protein [Pirellulales bacterium]|nr:O-antigen ligase family protein [Pirellulales bacterium]